MPAGVVAAARVLEFNPSPDIINLYKHRPSNEGLCLYNKALKIFFRFFKILGSLLIKNGAHSITR